MKKQRMKNEIIMLKQQVSALKDRVATLERKVTGDDPRERYSMLRLQGRYPRMMDKDIKREEKISNEYPTDMNPLAI